jgi:DnaJ-class molecular chaperone
MAKDFYTTLGVNKGASDKEIRSAYRRLARKLHPDVNPSDKTSEAQFKEINVAYDVLSDEEKRKKYDKYGDNWEHADEIERMQRSRGRGGFANYGGGYGSAGPGVQFEGDIDLQNLFGGIFGGDGGGRRRRGPAPNMRPPDTEQPIEVTLDEALTGATRMLITEGDRGESRRLEVKVPPGVDTGSRVRIAGEGRAGFDGRRSDLYLVITVRPHARFDRKGDDLYTDVEVPLTTPVLGGEVEVQALDKKLALRLPAGTQNGQTFRLGGLGMPKLSQADKRGDLFARVKVRLPQTPGDRERELFEELRQLGL